MEFQITLTNLSPLFSAAPGVSTISLDETVNPPGGGFPYIRTRTMKMAAQTMDGEMKTAFVPIIPSNTMRNLLRRTMLQQIIEPALKDRVQLSIGAYASIYSGSASGNPDGKPSTFTETSETRNHTFLGLFGGGPRMLEGRLKVDGLYPIHADASAVIGEGFESKQIRGSITDTVWTRRVDPIARLVDEEDAGVIEGGTESVNEWINAWFLNSTESKKKSSKKNDDDKQARGLNAFNAHEVVIPGVSWVWRISVDNPTEAQVGLILTALSQMNKLRIAGGHAKGYGQFVIDSIKVDGKDVWTQGAISSGLENYSDALAESLDEMDAEQFERFAASAK